MKGTLCFAPIVLCFICVPTSSLKADIVSADLVFSTQGQNMWGEGEASVFDASRFLGFQGEKSGRLFDGIVDVGVGYAGISPYASASWRAGVEVGLKGTSGSVDVVYPVGVTLEFPSVVTEGDLLTIGSSFYLKDGASMTTVFPDITPKADAVFDMNARIYAEGCYVEDCDWFDIVNLDASYRKSLLDFLPRVPTESGDSETYAIPDHTGTIQVTIPGDLDTVGSVSGTSLVSRTGEFAGEFIDAELNLLKLGELIPGPTGLIMADFNELEEGSLYLNPWPIHALLSWDAIDLGVGAIARITQEFEFVPDLRVDLLEYDGDVFGSFKIGETATFTVPDGVGSDFELTPVYRMDNTFTNDTGLRIDPAFRISILSGSGILTIHEFGVHEEFAIGPVFQDEWILHGLEIPGVYSKEFSLDFPTITAESFRMQVGSGGIPGAVPEPGSVVLFCTGLGGLGLAAWRRKK